MSSSTFSPHVHDIRSTNPRPLQAPDPNFVFDFDLLDPSMMELSSTMSMTTPFSHSISPPDSAGIRTPFPNFGAKLYKMTMRRDHSILFVPDMGAAPANRKANGNDSTSSQLDEFFDLNGKTFDRISDKPMGDPQTILTGGWFDADDVPPLVRDHLYVKCAGCCASTSTVISWWARLDLYFSKTSIFHSAINIPRFYARLTLPLSKRPHPSLMYVMYLLGCRLSEQPALRRLEQRFFEIASQKIHQGMGVGDRPLDLIRAMALIIGYLFAKELYNAGYTFIGQAIR
jgi:hypothetical protein